MTPEEMDALATPPFATVADLEARYRELTDEEHDVATVLLEDASNIILAELPAGYEVRPKVLVLLKPITCAMVKRAISSRVAGIPGADLPAASQMSITTGQVTQQLSFANPYGVMKLTPEEKRLLGISKQKIRLIDPLITWGERHAT